MAEEAGRPTFDLSSFSTFTFSATGQASALPNETSVVAARHHNVSQAQDKMLSTRRTELPRASQDEQYIDLAKYGPPEALAKLNQTVPVTVLAVIENSIVNVRGQVDTETQMRHHQDSTMGQISQDLQQYLASDKSPESIDKETTVDAAQSVPNLGSPSIVASDQINAASFYTPTEGGQSHLADAQSETGMDALTAEDTAPQSTPNPRIKASSTSAIPRRRDLIKALLRGSSKNDARRHVFRQSTGPLQFKAKLKHAKQMWQGETQIGFVFVAIPLLC